MSEAATAWKEMANDLGTLAGHLDNALAKGDDWIADDKDAFESSLTNFKGEIEQLRSAAGDIGGALDTVSNVYVVAYVTLVIFASACLVILIGLVVLLFIPYTSAAARIVIEQVGLVLTAASAKIALLLGTMATAVAAMVGGTLYGRVNINSRKSTIPDSADFEQIRIDYEAPRTFKVKEA
jgi:hypothetical protein